MDVSPEILIPAIFPTISETKCNRLPLIRFLSKYCSVPNREPLFVLSCFEEHPEFLLVLLQMLDTMRKLESIEERDEVAAVSELLELFFWRFKNCQTAQFITEYHILHFLREAALKWPDLSCVSYCSAVRNFLSHFPPDLSSINPALRKLLERVPQELLEEKNLFFGDNQFLPFVSLLNHPETFKSEECRGAIYDTIKFLLKSAPPTNKQEWLTEDFLFSFISGLAKDAKAYRDKLHMFVFIGHFIVYTLKAERMQLIRDQKWHEVANDCFKLANYTEARTNCIGFATCILHGYTQAFKDLSPFTDDSDFPQVILDFAKQHGFGEKSEAGETFGSIILTLTADKQASIVLHKNGILERLYPLVDDRYDSQVVRPALHAVGNIALSGHPVKQEILERGFHVTLIKYLDQKMTTGNSSVLSACCRVLHILASGDLAKRMFAEEGIVDILMRMLDTRRDNAEVCWRPLGLLSSLGFMSLSNREYIITEKVLKTVLDVLKTTKHSKVKSYTALVFLASIDSDRRSADLQSMEVTEIFQQVLQESERGDSSYDDLQKWGSSLLEKGHLFTIPLTNAPLKPEEEQLLATCMEQSISWPEKAYLPSVPNESVDGKDVTLLPLEESYLSAQFPEAPKLTDDATAQLLQLGLNPDRLLRVGRFFGSTHGHCSNCEIDGRSEELSFRPQSLSPHHYQELISRGWYRRGGVKLFRYRYNHNLDCSDWETRVLISEFDHRKHKSYKKVLRKMPEDRLTVETVPTQFIREACDLYNSYHLLKHDKPTKSEYSYCEHVVNSPFRNQSIDGFQYGTFHQLYRLDGKLVAVGVIDIVPNGVVSIYMWYDMSKEITKLSFGVYSSLKEIEFTRELSKCNPNIKYYYLQGWNGNNHKLSYKSKYEPEEFYSPCTVMDWVMSVDGIKKEQDRVKQEWLLANKQPASDKNSEMLIPIEQNCVTPTTSVPDGPVSGDALSLDRIKYKRETGLDKLDVMNTVVCLNHQMYIYLGHLLDTYCISSSQRQLMVERFEELLLAFGPELAKNVVIDLMACSTTGDLERNQIF